MLNINSKKELQLFILDYIKNKGVKSYTIAVRNSKKLQTAIETYEPDFPDLTYSARSYIICYGRPVCVVCGNYTNFDRNNWKFLDTCSLKCQSKNPNIIQKREQTCIERYGVKNPASATEIKEKIVNTFNKNYGRDYYIQSHEFKSKTLEWCKLKYGVEHFSKTDEFKRLMISTNNKNHGVDWFMQSISFREKSKETCMRKYNEVHHMKNSIIFEKQQRHSYYKKKYSLPSGKIIFIQGYENIVLDYLLQIYDETEIITSVSDIFNLVGKIEYLYNGIKHRYFPDFYIQKENLIIEVKSSRTYAINNEINLLKKQACLDKNLKFNFYIPQNNSITII